MQYKLRLSFHLVSKYEQINSVVLGKKNYKLQKVYLEGHGCAFAWNISGPAKTCDRILAKFLVPISVRQQQSDLARIIMARGRAERTTHGYSVVRRRAPVVMPVPIETAPYSTCTGGGKSHDWFGWCDGVVRWCIVYLRCLGLIVDRLHSVLDGQNRYRILSFSKTSRNQGEVNAMSDNVKMTAFLR